MSYSMYLCLTLATLPAGPSAEAPEPQPALDDALQPALDQIRQLVGRFRASPVSPAATAGFENELQQRLRQLGRATAEWTYNALEPAAAPNLPERARFETNPYRRLAAKTAQQVSTLFGPIRLRRLGYRAAPPRANRCCSRCARNSAWPTAARSEIATTRPARVLRQSTILPGLPIRHILHDRVN